MVLWICGFIVIITINSSVILTAKLKKLPHNRKLWSTWQYTETCEIWSHISSDLIWNFSSSVRSFILFYFILLTSHNLQENVWAIPAPVTQWNTDGYSGINTDNDEIYSLSLYGQFYILCRKKSLARLISSEIKTDVTTGRASFRLPCFARLKQWLSHLIKIDKIPTGSFTDARNQFIIVVNRLRWALKNSSVVYRS